MIAGKQYIRSKNRKYTDKNFKVTFESSYQNAKILTKRYTTMHNISYLFGNKSQKNLI